MVGCVDGILVKIKMPTAAETPKPVQFWTRKGYFALNVQAIVDARRCFLFLTMDCPGSVHDSVAFQFSVLGRHQHLLPAGYYILGDPAYKVHSKVLTPFEGRARFDNDYKANFSFYHSSLSMTVECAFGMLVQRFGVLWLQLSSTLVHNIWVVQACAALHNWMIDNSVAIQFELAPPSGTSCVRLEERPYINANGAPANMLGDSDGHLFEPAAAGLDVEMHVLREQLASAIQDAGMLRPVPEQVWEQARGGGVWSSQG